jgi:hypothetical protein
MKTLFLLCGILTTCLLNAQEKTEQYFVIKVQGEIQRLKTGNLLFTGDEIISNEALNFRTDYSRAAVISPSKGRFILSSPGKTDNKNKANFLPPMSNLSSRAIIVTASTINEILEYFSGDMLFLGYDTIRYDNSRMTLDKDNYLVISFDSSGVEKKSTLNASEGLICINSDALFKNQQPKAARITYRSSLTNEQYSDFVPVFPDKNKLLGEIQLIVKNSSQKQRKVVVTDITSYLNDFYGKISRGTVDLWLKQNLNF